MFHLDKTTCSKCKILQMRVTYFAICHSEQRRISGSVMQTIYEKWLNSAQRQRFGSLSCGKKKKNKQCPLRLSCSKGFGAIIAQALLPAGLLLTGWLPCKEVSIPFRKTRNSNVETSTPILNGPMEQGTCFTTEGSRAEGAECAGSRSNLRLPSRMISALTSWIRICCCSMNALCL